jgi:hypothetical protein
VAARTVLGPKPCPKVPRKRRLRLCSMFDHLVRACRLFPPGAGEPSINLPEQIPKELQIVRSDLDDNFIDKCQGNAVLRCFMTV